MSYRRELSWWRLHLGANRLSPDWTLGVQALVSVELTSVVLEVAIARTSWAMWFVWGKQ